MLEFILFELSMLFILLIIIYLAALLNHVRQFNRDMKPRWWCLACRKEGISK